MRSTCPYCGNHQTSHAQQYFFATISVLPRPTVSGRASRGYDSLERFAMAVSSPVCLVLRLLRVYTWRSDPRRALTGRARVLWEEAIRRGLDMQQLFIFGKACESYRVRIRGKREYFNGLPIPPERDAVAYQWMDDKFLLKQSFLNAGIPVPQGGEAWTARKTILLFDTLVKPVIMKPRSGSHGRHSITNIKTKEECLRARGIVSQLCQCVIVEEHLVGSVYRGTYVDGKIMGILRGDPPRITGDGVSTVIELIAAKNASRPARVGEFVMSDKAKEFLAGHGRTPETVLVCDEVIDLSEKVGLSYGGYTAEILDSTHPKLIEILRRAGDLLAAPVVGFDFIIPDATGDPDTQRWGIIEANAQPFIDLHNDPLEGKGVNVAAAVWDLWK